MSQRYIAGTDLEAAYGVVKDLNAARCSATIDVLGEDCTSIEQTETARDRYLEALDGFHSRSLNCNASVKLSEMGLRFDINRCTGVMRTLLTRAREKNNFIRINMEDSTVTSATLDIYRHLRKEFDNVGTVIQSYLRRSEKDITDLLDTGPPIFAFAKGFTSKRKISHSRTRTRSATLIANCSSNFLREALQESASQLMIRNWWSSQSS